MKNIYIYVRVCVCVIFNYRKRVENCIALPTLLKISTVWIWWYTEHNTHWVTG
jgi:hypothetical protein